MISDDLVRAFQVAAQALSRGVKDTGFTGNGIKKLDFKVGDQVFTALEQNPDKLSVPAQLARKGHKIIQIRDVEKAVLLGNVDVTENVFNSYESVPQPVDIHDLASALRDKDVELPAKPAVRSANQSSRAA